jgi:hypothetical protein
LKIGPPFPGKPSPSGGGPFLKGKSTPSPAGNPVSSPGRQSSILETFVKLWKLSRPIPKGPLLDRLAELPPGERMDALSLQLLLADRKIDLSEGEWKKLWELVREGKSLSHPLEKGEELMEKKRGDTEFAPLPVNGEIPHFRIFRDPRGRGSASLAVREGRVSVIAIRLETGGRRWEFLLSRSTEETKGDRMVVYTDDREMVDNPPPPWKDFRRAMAGYDILVERTPKYFQEDSFFSDIDSREPGRLVDFVI